LITLVESMSSSTTRYDLITAFEEMSPEQIHQQFATNVYGVMNVTAQTTASHDDCSRPMASTIATPFDFCDDVDATHLEPVAPDRRQERSSSRVE
jgi:hypothetical protein